MTMRKPDGWCVSHKINPTLLWQVFESLEEAEEAYPERDKWQINPICLIDPAEYDRLEAIEKHWQEFRDTHKPYSNCCLVSVDTDTKICSGCHDHCGITWEEE